MSKQATKRAIDSEAAYVEQDRPKRRRHENAHIVRLKDEHPSWTSPPNEDTKLVWRWNVADSECGDRSRGWPSGPRNADEHPPFDEGHSAQAKAVGEMDKRSPAARMMEIDGWLAQLSSGTIDILMRAYGPEEQSGPRAVHPQLKAKMGTIAMARIALTMRPARANGRSEGATRHFIMHEADAEELAELRRTCEAALFECWNRWADVRGRRQRVERHASEAEMLEALR